MNSCLYVGQVRHRRFKPRAHAFRYRLFQLYLDLDELDSVFRSRWFWSTRGPNLAWFRRRDHLGPRDQSLSKSVRDLVEAETGRRPRGPVRLLTHLRYFGYVMNPVSFYFCFDHDGETVDTVVAEVNNTPWGERHCYVLDQNMNTGSRRKLRFEVDKEFHVSPFMDLDMRYRWRMTRPDDHLLVHIENHQRGGKLFDATLMLERHEISFVSLGVVLARFPFMTAKVGLAIYFEALRIWLKKIPFVQHPKNQEAPGTVKGP
jgi:DUF1365 family protein